MSKRDGTFGTYRAKNRPGATKIRQAANRTESIKLLLVASQPILLEGLRQSFLTLSQKLEDQPDFQIVGETDTGQTALALARQLEPDIILCHVTPNSFRLVGYFQPLLSQVRLILLGSAACQLEFEKSRLEKTSCSKTVAWVLENANSEELLEVVRRVIQEKPLSLDCQAEAELASPPHCRNLIPYLAKDEHSADSLAVPSPVSWRELEILVEVAQGSTNGQIAARLNLSSQTVKNHLNSIFVKLQAKHRTHAVVIALNRGWLRVEEASHHSLNLGDGNYRLIIQ